MENTIICGLPRLFILIKIYSSHDSFFHFYRLFSFCFFPSKRAYFRFFMTVFLSFFFIMYFISLNFSARFYRPIAFFFPFLFSFDFFFISLISFPHFSVKSSFFKENRNNEGKIHEDRQRKKSRGQKTIPELQRQKKNRKKARNLNPF